MDAAPPARCKTIYPSYVPVSAELLKRLYVDERLTAADISARIGCSPITILRRLRQFGYVKLVSASHLFLDWVQATIRRILSMKGSIAVQ